MRRVSLSDANQALRQLLARPGFVRVEQPLISYDQLYGLVALGLAGVLAGGLVWSRRRHRKAPAK